MMIRIWAGLLLGALCSACTIRTADMTVLSTRNVNLDGVNLDALQGQTVEGTDTAWNVLLIPLGFPHLEDAVDDALDQGGGDILTDAVVHVGGWWFIIGQQWITVRGTVVKTRSTISEAR